MREFLTRSICLIAAVFIFLLSCPPEPDVTAPGPVTGLQALAGDGTVLLTWTDPVDGDFGQVLIAWTPGGEELAGVNAGVGAHTVRGLSNGTLYTFTVQASDQSGNLSEAATVSATPVPDTTAPANVTLLHAAEGNEQAILTWTDPADADLDHVEITWTPDGPGAIHVSAGTGTYSASSLTNNTLYTFIVRSVDGSGNRSAGVAVAARPFVPDAIAPADVTVLDAVAGNEQAVLTWTDPADADLDHVEITWTHGGSSATSVEPGIRTYTATGLGNGTPYTFTLVSVDSTGNRSVGVADVAQPTAGPLDSSLAMDSISATDAARAMGICDGLVSAVWQLPDGTTTADADFDIGHGILDGFGSSVVPREGSRLLALSTGTARDSSDTGYLSELDKGYANGWPTGFPIAGAGCPNPPDAAFDGISLVLTLQMPVGVKGFSFDGTYYTLDYPDYLDGNFSDRPGASVRSVTNDTTLDNILVNNVANYIVSDDGFGFTIGAGLPEGTAPLSGTGFETGAATGWLTWTVDNSGGFLAANDTIVLKLFIMDSGDGNFTSTILFDNFRWIPE